MVAKGRPSSRSWTGLANTAQAGETSVDIEGFVDWPVGANVVISPTDYDMHEAEVKKVVALSWGECITSLTLDSPLVNKHYGEAAPASHGSRDMKMQARVGLLSRNIVIRGSGEGEEKQYHHWNVPEEGSVSDAVQDNGVCEHGETSLTDADCHGPAYEVGVSILVASYSEDFQYCDQNNVCSGEVTQDYGSKIHLEMDAVEVKYYGQNNIRAGFEFRKVANVECRLSNVSMTHGYYHAIDLQESSNIQVEDVVFYRSILPSLRVNGGQENQIRRNLGVVGIYWYTFRGSQAPEDLASEKLTAMIGMFHDTGSRSLFVDNVASGSERAGFSGSAVSCQDDSSFVGNEAHACLMGYMMNHYAPQHRPCCAITDFRAWKIHLYGIYGEVKGLKEVRVKNARISDASVGTYLIMIGADAVSHQRMEQKVKISNSLYVGRSDNAGCSVKSQTLFTCKDYRSYCNHLGGHESHIAIAPSVFQSGPSMAPKIHGWNDGDAYQTLYGQTEVHDVTFANYQRSAHCQDGPRQNGRDFMVSNRYVVSSAGGNQADGNHPVVLKSVEKVNSQEDSLVHWQLGSSGWITQEDCIDMDCDGPRHGVIRDDDGSFLGDVGSILTRAEIFSDGSFFGESFFI